MRSPLQGGLPPVDVGTGAVVEIACDESGFSGTNLLDTATPVITHASVDLRVDEAAELIAALRSGFRCSPHEFKSGRFLRSPNAGKALASSGSGFIMSFPGRFAHGLTRSGALRRSIVRRADEIAPGPARGRT